jgi:hypothetical protein
LAEQLAIWAKNRRAVTLIVHSDSTEDNSPNLIQYISTFRVPTLPPFYDFLYSFHSGL